MSPVSKPHYHALGTRHGGIYIYIYVYIYIYIYICMYVCMYIRHSALCRVRGNEASELGTHSILLFDGLPNFTDLIQVSTYLEDCFVLLILN